ncbi:MAG: glycoside hydrolase family 16 protein, partial [Acidimicrobiia bacterium]|nr:glycoside hydrolase family 16 protein [Acidimicrobiia bacterium]
RQASASIIDDDPYDPLLLDDFERGLELWSIGEGVAAATVEIAAGDAGTVPGQGAFEGVLSLEQAGSGDPFDGSLHRDFPIGQDWTGNDAIFFWFNGSASGDDVTVRVYDNRAPDPGPSGWSLVWSDEFDDPAGTPPNPDHWGYELGDGTMNGIPGWGNQELQYYTDSPDNAATDGAGNLVITAREADGLDCYYGPCAYSSARLVTTNKAEFAYGRIESRILVPDGDAGLWPAFWSLGTDIDRVDWPQTGEIDIMEYVSRIPDEIFGTIHGPGYSGGLSYGNTFPFPGGVATDYHTFAIEWQPDRIDWYVDGNLYHTATPADVDPNEWVFNDPIFLLFNMAIGGNFGGDVSPDLTFPQTYAIDYVRAYQGPDTA